MASQHSNTMEEIVVLLIRKLYSRDLNVSPVAKNLNVTANLSSGLMLDLITVTFLAILLVISPTKNWNCSLFILKNSRYDVASSSESSLISKWYTPRCSLRAIQGLIHSTRLRFFVGSSSSSDSKSSSNNIPRIHREFVSCPPFCLHDQALDQASPQSTRFYRKKCTNALRRVTPLTLQLQCRTNHHCETSCMKNCTV